MACVAMLTRQHACHEAGHIASIALAMAHMRHTYTEELACTPATWRITSQAASRNSVVFSMKPQAAIRPASFKRPTGTHPALQHAQGSGETSLERATTALQYPLREP